jgi:hypothetical protein
MMPTLRTPLGLKGHRPIIGNLDCHDLVSVCGALTLVTGQLTTRLLERRQAYVRGRKPRSGPRRLQAALARHGRDSARASPAVQHPRGGLVSDHAPWPQGPLVTAALKAVPHLALYRWPSSSPQLQVIERFGKVLRRRATHNRLLPALTQLTQTLRTSLCYDQTRKHRVLSRITAPKKRTKRSAA